MKISVSLKRELDFQGLDGFVSVCFVLFFGVWFLDGFGNGFLVVWGWILGAFWLPKSIKKRDRFSSGKSEAKKRAKKTPQGVITISGFSSVGSQGPLGGL